MTKVTTDSLRIYVRSLDERIEEKAKYPDSWVDLRINEAYEMLSTYRQSFLNEEILDLKQHIIDGVSKLEIDLDYDVVGFKRIFSTSNKIKWEVTPDNVIHLTLDIDRINPDEDNLFTVQYYYFPTVVSTEVFMSADIYQMLRHAIQYTVWSEMRDIEKAGTAMARFMESARTVINGLDIDVKYNEEWNGGFLL